MLRPDWPAHILCPVDFSELSTAALHHAAQWSAIAGAPLDIVHAAYWDAPPYITHSGLDDLASQYQNALAASRQHLRDFVAATCPGCRTESHVYEGRPVDAILRSINDLHPDILVLGTHGRSGLDRRLLGSVAETVLRHAHLPVLTVRDATPPSAPPNHILCALPARATDTRPLEVAAALAARSGAALTVLSVAANGEPAGPAACAEVPERVRASCDVRTVVRTGDPDLRILETAEELRASLLVVGGRHRLFRDVTELGSTTSRLVRHATVPLLTIFQ